MTEDVINFVYTESLRLFISPATNNDLEKIVKENIRSILFFDRRNVINTCKTIFLNDDSESSFRTRFKTLLAYSIDYSTPMTFHKIMELLAILAECGIQARMSETLSHLKRLNASADILSSLFKTDSKLSKFLEENAWIRFAASYSDF